MSKQNNNVKKTEEKVAPGEPSFNDTIANDRKAYEKEVKKGDYTRVTSLRDD